MENGKVCRVEAKKEELASRERKKANVFWGGWGVEAKKTSQGWNKISTSKLKQKNEFCTQF